jgi:hypothetical protein
VQETDARLNPFPRDDPLTPGVSSLRYNAGGKPWLGTPYYIQINFDEEGRAEHVMFNPD